MLRIVVTHQSTRQELEHGSGPIELGRGPQRGNVARIVVQDPYVSRDHVRIDEHRRGMILIENLSRSSRLLLDDGQSIDPGQKLERWLPASIQVGETLIETEIGATDAVDIDSLKTIAVSKLRAAEPVAALSQLGAEPTAEEMAQWFETVIAIQRAAVGTPAFYQQTASALVDRVGLDSGMVMLRKGTSWETVAHARKDDTPSARTFSHTILRQIVVEKRTFYQPALTDANNNSLMGVQSVVASPIFDAAAEVIGVVYGTRFIRPRAREIGKLEAHVVQLLASAVGVGLARLEQENAANKLRVEKEAAEMAAHSKGQFLATVSHELRTPLTTIIGYSEMLLEQVRGDGQVQYAQDLERIHSSGQHLHRLINDILDLSKIEAGKMELAPEPFDLPSLISDMTMSLGPLVSKNQNRLEVDCPRTLGTCVGDAVRIRQCLLNLLSNACKFTEKGTVGLSVRREQDPSGDWARFTVSDTGIGMTPSQLAKLFQPFAQADASTGRKYGGTGLGLSISQKLCQAMGGSITVTSEPGRGSIFTMRIRVDDSSPK